MKRLNLILTLASLTAATPILIPEALAFPYHRAVRGATIWSDQPLPPAIDKVVARADALVATSPLDRVPSGCRVFLTHGGWRWRWLSLPLESGALGLTRPLSEAVIINDSDVTADRVGGVRTLSGVLAHERVHTLVRDRYGLVASVRLPLWLREGYPDYVAHESALSDAQAAAVRRSGKLTRQLAYYDARRRVMVALAANGGSVERLFADVNR